MRLWHVDLLSYLPKKQLIAQWRELNLIYRKQPKHILINYIYNYPKEFLKAYSDVVILEMQYRGINIQSYENYDNYFKDVYCDVYSVESNNLQYREHNLEYLDICYWNLYEKHLRGQRDFTDDVWQNIVDDIEVLRVYNRTQGGD